MSAAAAADAVMGATTGEDPAANRILERANSVRTSPPNLEPYRQVVSEDAFQLVSSFASNAAARRKVFDSQNAEAFAALLIFFDKVSSEAPLQYIVTLIDDILEEDPSRATLLIQAGDNPLLAHPAPRQGQSSLSIFVRKLSRSEDEYVRHLSARVAARLLLHGADPEEDTLKTYFKWLLAEVQGGDRTRMLLALSCLAQVFRRTPFRLAFCRLPNAVDVLRVQVGVDAPIQQLYQAILCLWILSFSGDAVELMGESAFAAVASVADVLAGAKKEKVVRVCVAFLRNMAEVENKERALEATTLMVSHRLLAVVQGLATQGTFSDEELKADAEVLLEHLRVTFEHMSTFDEYVAEVKSGKLEWSPVHRSERFWRENATRLNDKKHELLKLLVNYLTKSEDVTSVAVAIHDCGEYVTHYPYGRKALNELGAKAHIMELMEHEDSTVRYEALLAVQKMMTDNWEYLGKKVKAEAAERSA